MDVRYLKARPLLWESLQHLKLIRKEVLESGGKPHQTKALYYTVLTPTNFLANRFQMLVGTSRTMPDDIPQGDYSIPELCQVPATPALTRTQLKLKNALWPSIFSPHLLPKEIQFSRSEVIRAEQGIKMALEEAKRASVLGEVRLCQSP
jgi:tRNA-specific adenosine deaminase 3